MSKLAISLIGQISAVRRDGEPVDFKTRKSKALLAMLALSGAKGMSRERCADLLWPRSAEPQARASLRQCVTALGKALGPDRDVLLSRRDTVSLAVDGIERDIDAVDALDKLSPTASRPETLGALRGALFGDFSLNEESFESWQREQRLLFDTRLGDALLRVGRRWRHHGALGAATQAIGIAREIDPFNEPVLRELMRCYDASGARARALTDYDAFVKRLTEELGTAPSEETHTLAEQLRQDRASAGDSLANPAAASRRINRPALALLKIDFPPGNETASQIAIDLYDALSFRLSRRRGIRLTTPETDDAEGADYTLRGRASVRQETVRITLSLSARDQASDVWVDQIEGSLDDQFEFIDRACDRADAALRVQTTGFDSWRVDADEIDATTVDGLLTRAAGHFYRVSIEDYEAAIRLIDRALEADSENSMAMSMRVEAEYSLNAAGAARESTALRVSDCRDLMDRAVSRDPKSDYAYTTRAFARVLLLNDPAGGLQDAEQALTLVPGYVWALVAKGQALMALGDTARAVAPLEEALTVSADDPFLPLLCHTLIRASLLSGQFETAQRVVRRAVDRLPEVAAFHWLDVIIHEELEASQPASIARQKALSASRRPHLLVQKNVIHEPDLARRTALLTSAGFEADDPYTPFIL